jgi:hypothetical protein
MRVWIVLGLVFSVIMSCGKDAATDVGFGECGGEVLFGRPNERTGLTSEQCKPECSCGGRVFVAPEYTIADADALLTWVLTDPPAELTTDPYASAAPTPGDPNQVCAVLIESPATKGYSVTTYDSEQAAHAAGAKLTHFGACGVCSSLQDLSAYMRNNDLTAPVRQCGLDFISGPPAEHIQCLEDLGFSRPCAQVWYYNTLHTRSLCSTPCFATLKDPYHLPDGTLNECLLCDEQMSGDIFKAIAGRTRRNTGLPNAMCRPCSEVKPLVHAYE